MWHVLINISFFYLFQIRPVFGREEEEWTMSWKNMFNSVVKGIDISRNNEFDDLKQI